jgi:hypothetical protein
VTDAELWQLTSDARLRAEAAERGAKEDPSADARERWLKVKAEYERLARQWQTRIGGGA